MGSVKVDNFAGMVPAVDTRLLPANASESCSNVWLTGGTIRGFGLPVLVRELTNSAAKKVYRIPVDNSSFSVGQSYWLEFGDPDTDVIRTPTRNDQYQRYYWASPSDVPKYNTLSRISSGDDPYILGVPVPDVAPSLTIIPGTGDVSVSRSYVYTWVTAFGEEGPPSPPTLETHTNDSTWNVHVTPPDNNTIADHNIAYVNIYRTVTTTAGTAAFTFVAQIAVTQSAYPDALQDSDIASGTILPSTDWVGPPALKGMIALPNGMIAGWTENTVHFCEPYRPHAWPVKYDVAVEHPIIGLGVFGQALVVCTSSRPWVLTGINPASITATKVDIAEPCVRRSSIVSFPGAVVYASPRGLIAVSSSTGNITKDQITKVQWAQDYDPANILGLRHDNRYMAVGTGASRQGGFSLDPNDNSKFSPLELPVSVDGVSQDAWTGYSFIISDGSIWLWDPSDATQMMPYRWRSKLFQLNYNENIGAFKVFFDDDAVRLPKSPTPPWVTSDGLSIDKFGQIRVYCNGVLRVTRDLTESGRAGRLPSGYKGQYWQFEIVARVPVSNVQIASTARELRDV